MSITKWKKAAVIFSAAALFLTGCKKEETTVTTDTAVTDTTMSSDTSVTMTSSSADTSMTGTAPAAPSVALTALADGTFAEEAANGGMAEVQLAQLAEQKAQSADVKAFAQRMNQDHSAANSEFAQLLVQKGSAAPATLDKEHADGVSKLSALSGAAFDKEYMKMMVEDHDKDVALFDKESKEGKDAEMKSWAGAKLPTLKEHQKMAKEISGKLK
jgi:putative membrane protein